MALELYYSNAKQSTLLMKILIYHTLKGPKITLFGCNTSNNVDENFEISYSKGPEFTLFGCNSFNIFDEIFEISHSRRP